MNGEDTWRARIPAYRQHTARGLARPPNLPRLAPVLSFSPILVDSSSHLTTWKGPVTACGLCMSVVPKLARERP